MRHVLPFAGFFVLILALISMLGCSADRAQTTKSPVLVIGAILPLTGDGAEFGKDEQVGAQMAVDALNAGTAGLKVELRVEDSRTQPKDGVSAFQKLTAEMPQPVALLTVMSSVSSALVPLAERQKIPLFCVAAAPNLTRGTNYVFRALPTSEYQARVLLQSTYDKLKYKTASILFVNDDFGSAMESAFSEEAKRRDVQILLSEGLQPGAADFRPSLLKLKDSKPDVMLVAAFGSLLGSAVKQLREVGFDSTILSALEIGYPKVLDVAGSAAEGVLFVDTKFNAASSDPQTAAFVAEFKKRVGREPSLDAVLAYDEVQLIYAAAQRSGVSPEGIRTGLRATLDYKSINGNASMQSNGDLAYELVLKTIKGGKPVLWSGE